MTNASTEMLNKVLVVTASSWIIQIVSTTIGETVADYLAVHVGLGTAVTGVIMATQPRFNASVARSPAAVSSRSAC